MSSNGLIDIFFGIIQKIENLNIDYMVVGSVASMTYGFPRMTHDLDMVVDLKLKDIQKFEKAFGQNTFYCPPIEVIQAEVTHRGQFNVLHQPSGYKVDIMILKHTPHSVEEFKKKVRIPFWQGSHVFMARPEDIIIKKLEYYRQGQSEKHLTDIRAIQSQTRLDQAYLMLWIETLGLTDQWNKAS